MRRRAFLFGMAGAALAPPLPSCAAPQRLGAIAFTRRDGLWIQELPAGRPAWLVNAAKVTAPRFSPSGQWIAYFQNGIAGVVSRDGKQHRTFGPMRIQWWPGRDDLLVENPPAIQVFSAANGWTAPAKAIPRARFPLLFSPDGKRIVYGDVIESGRGPGGEPMPTTGRLLQVEADALGREPKVLVSKDLSGQIPCAWSRRGDAVFFWEDLDFSASLAADGLELFHVPTAGGPPRPVGVSTLLDDDLRALSPAQDKLAITAGGGREEWLGKGIAVIDLDTAAIAYLTDEHAVAVCPSWSPGGRHLAYSAASINPGMERDDPPQRLLAKRRIWVVDAVRTRAPRQLTRDDRYRDEEPMWSADGQHILFCRQLVETAGNDDKTLWLMEAGGSHPVQIAEIYPDAGPLSSDGTWFGYYGHIEWRDMFDWFRGA